MLTRVVRFWHETDWHYRVEQYVQATGDEVWFTSYPNANYEWTPPKEGEWYWSRYIVPNGGAPGIASFSREKAMGIASRLSEGLSADGDDVVAEFGHQGGGG